MGSEDEKGCGGVCAQHVNMRAYLGRDVRGSRIGRHVARRRGEMQNVDGCIADRLGSSGESLLYRDAGAEQVPLIKRAGAVCRGFARGYLYG